MEKPPPEPHANGSAHSQSCCGELSSRGLGCLLPGGGGGGFGGSRESMLNFTQPLLEGLLSWAWTFRHHQNLGGNSCPTHWKNLRCKLLSKPLSLQVSMGGLRLTHLHVRATMGKDGQGRVCLFVKEVLRILASGEYHQLQWEIQTFQAWGSLAAESFFTMPLDGDCSPKHMSWGLPASPADLPTKQPNRLLFTTKLVQPKKKSRNSGGEVRRGSLPTSPSEVPGPAQAPAAASARQKLRQAALWSPMGAWCDLRHLLCV